LSVQHGRIAALHDVSVSVFAGQLAGVIGANGAGKSTLLMTIAGAHKPSRGSILYEGRRIDGMTPERLVEAGIALVPERRRIFARLSVEENLKIGLSRRRDRDAGRRDRDRLLQRFPILAQRYKMRAGNLSGGEQQQLAIARSLLTGPKLLLVDEPSLGLAPLIVDEIFQVLEELKQHGVTVLLVEQLAERTVRTADVTYVLRNGHVDASGTETELLADSTQLSDLYLGPV
jgi:branched-chain amino acid transport system ATP-binding protein